MSVHVLEYVRHTNGVWTLPSECVENLRHQFPDVRFSSPETQADADGLLPEADVVLGWAVNRDNLPAARRLRWIHATAAGIGSLLFEGLVESPVVLTNSRGLHATDMAEHAIGVMLAFARKLHLARDDQHQRRWDEQGMWQGPPEMRRLEGATLVVVGLGAVGGAVATRARALGMRVIAVRRHPATDPAPADEQHGIAALAEQLERADWVVLAAPLTRESRDLIGARELARMKDQVVLVNLGRGSLIDEAALIQALRAGRIAGAALDVFREEPLPPDHPFWTMPQVIVTPHVSGYGPRYWERAIGMFADNLLRYVDGRPLMNVVDKRAGY